MTEEVEFIRGNDRISQLAQRADIADGVTRVRAEMAEADRTYAMGLAASGKPPNSPRPNSPAGSESPRPPSAASNSPATCSCPPSTPTSEPSAAAPASSSPSPTATRQPSTSHNSDSA
ncbi:MAG: hypothetical protein ABSA53_38895, partial [Streptosporangiaceae bacterium]